MAVRKVTKKTLKAVDALIVKYSKPLDEEEQAQGIFGCPLCLASGNHTKDDWCNDCPNLYFDGDNLGCTNRADRYPELDYRVDTCFPTLKVFWTKFKEAAENGNTSHDSIKFALAHYKD